MIALTEITNLESFALIVFLVLELLRRNEFVYFVYRQKKQYKLLKSRLLFKRITSFRGV